MARPRKSAAAAPAPAAPETKAQPKAFANLAPYPPAAGKLAAELVAAHGITAAIRAMFAACADRARVAQARDLPEVAEWPRTVALRQIAEEGGR